MTLSSKGKRKIQDKLKKKPLTVWDTQQAKIKKLTSELKPLIKALQKLKEIAYGKNPKGQPPPRYEVFEVRNPCMLHPLLQRSHPNIVLPGEKTGPGEIELHFSVPLTAEVEYANQVPADRINWSSAAARAHHKPGDEDLPDDISYPANATLAERKALAKAVGLTGDARELNTMNNHFWRHGEVELPDKPPLDATRARVQLFQQAANRSKALRNTGKRVLGPVKRLDVVLHGEHDASFQKIADAFRTNGGDFEKYFM